jgi:hypothetical protein
MQTNSGRPDRTLIVLVSIIAAIVLLALVVVFTRGAPAPLDPATPEGTVQAYTTAVLAGDRAAATALLVQTIGGDCQRSDVYPSDGTRVTLVSTTVSGDSATVRVAISENAGGGIFGTSSYEYDDVFGLTQEGGDWKIATAPWQFTICYNTEDGK